MNQGPRALYETLARYEWWRRGWGRARPGEQLELRKQLAPADRPPSDGCEGLDRWLFEHAEVDDGGAVADFGCGFGASLMRWVEWSGGNGLGVTTSRFQAARATAEADRRGLGARCSFEVRDYAEPISGGFAAVVAIEALGHAPRLDAVLRNAHRALSPTGRFIWVEDLIRDRLRDDRDVEELAHRWQSPPLRDLATARSELSRAGLTVRAEVDLTSRVVLASSDRIDRRVRSLSRWRAVFPFAPWRRLADAFLGGCALERLYVRGLACYVVFVCEPSAT